MNCHHQRCCGVCHINHFIAWKVLDTHQTSWRIFSNGMVRVSTRGADGVTTLFVGDPTAWPTALVMTDTAGGRLPLRVITCGRTTRSKQGFRDRYQAALEKELLFITHQKTGWTSQGEPNTIYGGLESELTARYYYCWTCTPYAATVMLRSW
jgi:hypothetical protein